MASYRHHFSSRKTYVACPGTSFPLKAKSLMRPGRTRKRKWTTLRNGKTSPRSTSEAKESGSGVKQELKRAALDLADAVRNSMGPAFHLKASRLKDAR